VLQLAGGFGVGPVEQIYRGLLEIERPLINNIATMRHKIEQVLSDASRLAGLKASARALGRPRSAFDVARIALSM
jgi:hypothetical protein